MATEGNIQTERVDDIPLLMGQQVAMGLPTLIDEVINGHGNRGGLSIGWTIAGWLSFILSEADHRMSYVEAWAAKRMQTLQALIPGPGGTPVRVQDFDDDRLGDVLRYLSDDGTWQVLEQRLGAQLVSVYALPVARVHLDSTTATLYHEVEGSSLFAYGHSKDHRPDLPQLKVMLGSLDPLGLPLTTLVVPGNRADDGLYWPAIQQVRAVLPQSGLLYIADSKMEALSVRVRLASQSDYYLVPLSQKGEQAQWLATLLQPVLSQEQALVAVYAPDTAQPEVIAQGYEVTHEQQAEVDGQVMHWQERVLVVFSPTLAAQAEQGLQQRLQRAEEKLRNLTPAPGRGKRPATDLAHLQQAVESILTHYRVSGLFSFTYHEQRTQRHIRAYGQQPARSEEQVRYQLQVVRNEEAIDTLIRQMGWRLFVTNAPADQLPLSEAVLAYRTGSSIERNFSRLKGRPLGLRPFYVQREDHVKGMVRLLSLALRLLTLMEFVVRRTLQNQPEPLGGLYPGNPKQSTLRPTTERLLAAFKEVTLTLIHLPGHQLVHVTPLTPLQQRILHLLGLSPTLYADLALAPPNLA